MGSFDEIVSIIFEKYMWPEPLTSGFSKQESGEGGREDHSQKTTNFIL